LREKKNGWLCNPSLLLASTIYGHSGKNFEAEIVARPEFRKINKVFILYMQKDSAFFSLPPDLFLYPCPVIYLLIF
jgi:hypothetical protein